MTSSPISVFSDLSSKWATWSLLSAFLKSEEGGRLRVDDRSIPESPYALIRYVKGQSDLSRPHVRAFRSVVWDTVENRPVSVTPFKSVDGERLPLSGDSVFTGSLACVAEEFVDGTLVGAFYDKHNSRWRIHTRSTLDAVCRYYSQSKSFADMFDEAAAAYNWDTLDKSVSYSFVLQHPENRIVVPVAKPTLYLVQKALISSTGLTRFLANDGAENFGLLPQQIPVETKTASDLHNYIMRDLALKRHHTQGIVVKMAADGSRWKVRTAEYSRVRRLRGNSARRDYLWLDAWRNGMLPEYLALFPEERLLADATVNRWKRATGDVHHLYTDVFKARSLARDMIPQKYRPLVYGLHTLYTQSLKPVGKTVDWKTVLQYMNDRDTAQKLFVLNWELRQMNMQAPAASTIPVEPPVSVGTEMQTEARTEA